MRNKQYLLYHFPKFEDMREFLEYCVMQYNELNAFRFTSKKEECTKTFSEFGHDVNAVRALLNAQGLLGTHIAILGENSYEWIVSFFAVITGGNVAIPIDKELSNSQITGILHMSNCKVLIYADAYSDVAQEHDEIHCICIEDIIPDSLSVDNDVTRPTLTANTLCAIVYTSGTTGIPKGAMLTHGNLASNVVSTCKHVYIKNSTVLILPLHHMFGMTAAVTSVLLQGCENYITGSLRYLSKALLAEKPYHITAVPLIVETLYKRIWDTARKSGKDNKLRFAIAFSNFLLRVGIDLRQKLFVDVLKPLGGNLDLIICGGAALDEKYTRFFISIGVNIINGYGITECSPIVAVNRNKYNVVGSVGTAIEGCEVRLADVDSSGTGEIFVRGAGVMKGYYNDEQSTDAVFDGEWFKTGDLGRIDKDGIIYITGRKKNLIILANGENVAAEELETLIYSIDYVNEAVVSGKEGVIVAEVFLNEDIKPNARTAIHADITAINRSLPPYKNITKIVVRDTEFPKTTTKKIKRNYEESKIC